MQVSEILRKIADIVDQEEGNVEQAAVVQPAQTIQQEPVAEPVQEPVPAPDATIAVTRVAGEVETGTDELCSDEVTMVSPLQQEHELLKKSQGVDNNVSEFADDEYDDELAAMKKSAGIGDEPQGPVDHAADCRTVSLNPRANAALEANNKAPLNHTQRRNR